MKKLLGILVVLLMLVLPAAAQYTTVSGVVTDPNLTPYSNGTITFDYVNGTGCTGFIGFNSGVPIQTSYVTGLDSAGNIVGSGLSIKIPDNTQLVCPTSQWKVTACNQPRSVCFASNITISGGSQSLTSSLVSAALQLPQPTGANNARATITAQFSGVGSTDNNLVAYNLTAGQLNANLNKTVLIKGYGVYTVGAASILESKVKLCTVSGCGSGTVVTPCDFLSTNQANVVTNVQFSFECIVSTTTLGTSGTVLGHGTGLFELGASSAAALTAFGDVTTTNSSAIDLTAADFLQVTFRFATSNAGNAVTLQNVGFMFLN